MGKKKPKVQKEETKELTDEKNNQALDHKKSSSRHKSLHLTLHQLFPSVRQPTMAQVKKAAKKHGLEVKFGDFSPEEDAIIRRNFDNFCKDLGIEDSLYNRWALLGYLTGMKLEDKSVKRLAKEYGFKFCLGEGLPNRLIGSIYQRARRVCVPLRQGRELDKNEYASVIKSCSQLDPRRFTNLVLQTKVCPKTLWSYSKNPPRESSIKNKWTPEETRRMVKRLFKKKKIKSAQEVYPHTVKWESIARKVPNHNAEECKRRFIALRNNRGTKCYGKFFEEFERPFEEATEIVKEEDDKGELSRIKDEI